MVNVGQLARERHPRHSIAVCLGTYRGTVTASRGWDDRPERMRVPDARAGSYDRVFHGTELDRFLLVLQPLRERGQRAIGVVHHPEREAGNYVPTVLAERYDAYIHSDCTRAVKPLGIEPA